ncbi:hypothetical protein CK203_114807 [Vitis vinifera]|uniref:Pleckstrin-like plant domain-containing protein n=1 Tax=Vitis vinifera TaxID=29760 RepID=A0A438CDB4_VITVI|nr:hypothetical protein CK203_114807 [Vitis vinifera]
MDHGPKAIRIALKGAATLKGRAGYKNRLNGSAPVLPIEESNELDSDLEKHRSMLAKGAQLTFHTSDGRCLLRSVSIILNSQAKVILKIRKLNLMNTFFKKEGKTYMRSFMTPLKLMKGIHVI